MDRRELLRVLGTVAALPFVGGSVEEALAASAHAHRGAGSAGFRTLNPAQQRLVTALAERILPRSDTPGATDVGVAPFIDFIATDWASDAERREFLAGLDAIDEMARTSNGAAFADLPDAASDGVMRTLDGMRHDSAGAGKTFGSVKSLTVYGYFTSERVQREVLKTRMFFSHYDGNAPV